MAKKVGTGLVGRLATEAAKNGVEDAVSQLASTGTYNPRAAAENMVPGLSALNRRGGGGARSGGASSSGSGGGFNPLGLAVGGGGPGCSTGGRRHSFDPKTQVLMADGSTRPTEDVNVGDKVLATDPVAGTSEPKQVTQLHRNNDKDLTDLTVRDQDGKVTKVGTTWHHPFWNASERKWSDAKDLKPGTKLLVRGKGAVTVVAVLNKLGAEEMRDLTVADIHTYFVVVDDEPVLVHNNNKICDPDDELKKEFMDLGKKRIEEVQKQLGDDDVLPGAFSVGRDRTTGRTYYGESGSGNNLHPDVTRALPGQSQLDNGRPPEVCAEARMCTNARNDGQILPTLTLSRSTRRVRGVGSVGRSI